MVSKVWEDIGTWESYPGINATIRVLNSGLRVSVDQGVLEEATVAALTQFPSDGNSAREARQRLSRIRSTGWPIEPYSGLSSEKLKSYLGNVQGAISAIARKNCPEILVRVEEENSRRVREAYHY